MSSAISRAAAAMGRKGGGKGGRAGTGAAKRRTPEQYREIQAKALHARRVKAARHVMAGYDSAERSVAIERIRVAWGQDVLRDALAQE
jgi:hypothetical protein